MNEPGDLVVRLDLAASRYEVVVEGLPCVADFVRDGDRVIFTHTFVPPELRGRGIAEKLVRAALADVRAKGLKVMPACSYVARFIDRHREWSDLVVS